VKNFLSGLIVPEDLLDDAKNFASGLIVPDDLPDDVINMKLFQHWCIYKG